MSLGNFGGGDGSESYPWIIEDELDFIAIENKDYSIGAYFYFSIVNDLDLSSYIERLGDEGIKISIDSRTGGEIHINGNNHTLSLHTDCNIRNKAISIFCIGRTNKFAIENLNFKLTHTPNIENDTIDMEYGTIRIVTTWDYEMRYEQVYINNCQVYMMWRTIQRPYFNKYIANIMDILARDITVSYTTFEFDIDISGACYATWGGSSNNINRFDFRPMLGKCYRCYIDVKYRNHLTKWEDHPYRGKSECACVLQGTFEECIINYNLDFKLIDDFTHYEEDTNKGWQPNWEQYKAFNDNYWIGLYDTNSYSGYQAENQLINSYVTGKIDVNAIALIRTEDKTGTTTIPSSLHNILNVKNVMKSRYSEVIENTPTNPVVTGYVCVEYKTTPFWGTTFHNTIENYVLNTDLIDDNTVETLNGNEQAIEASWHNNQQMKDINTFLNYGWNFTDIWGIDPSINNGYPYLQWHDKKESMSLLVQGQQSKIQIPFYNAGSQYVDKLVFNAGVGLKEIYLVDITDPKALPIRISTPTGIKALSK